MDSNLIEYLDASMPETGLTVQMLTAKAYIWRDFESAHRGDQALLADGLRDER